MQWYKIRLYFSCITLSSKLNYVLMNSLLPKTFKTCLLTMLFIVIFLSMKTLAASGTELVLDIAWWWLTIGAPANYSFGSVSASVTDQEVTGQFTDYLWVEDMEAWYSGYFTTVQCDGLHWSFGNILTGIYMKRSSMTTILWINNPRVHIQNVFSDYYSINQPVVYFYRDPALNYGVITKYGDMPFVKIVIPWGSAPWSYLWTITFTLYVN